MQKEMKIWATGHWSYVLDGALWIFNYLVRKQVTAMGGEIKWRNEIQVWNLD